MTTSNLLAYFIIASGIAIVFTLLGIVYEMHKSKVYWMRTIPKPTENLSQCGNNTKPLLYAVSSGKSIDEVMKGLCEKHQPTLWGEKSPEFQPVVCDKKLGDGLQLIWFQTSDQRPYWWWVFIDSKWNMGEEDYTLQVYDLIEDEFGSIPEEDEEDYNEDDYGDVMKCYPMIVKNDGILWGTQDFFKNSI